jgi:hypothetical protein
MKSESKSKAQTRKSKKARRPFPPRELDEAENETIPDGMKLLRRTMEAFRDQLKGFDEFTHVAVKFFDDFASDLKVSVITVNLYKNTHSVYYWSFGYRT